MFTIISDSCGLFDLGQQRQHPDAHLESVESMKVMDVEGLCVNCFGISGMKTQKNTLRLTQGFSSFPIGLSPTKFQYPWDVFPKTSHETFKDAMKRLKPPEHFASFLRISGTGAKNDEHFLDDEYTPMIIGKIIRV